MSEARHYDRAELGSRMSAHFVAISQGLSVKGAMRELIARAADCDNIHTLFVLDGEGRLVGGIDLTALIVARGEDDLAALIRTDIPTVLDTDRISEQLERLRSCDEDLIPVLCEQGRLLGVLSVRELLEIVDEELGEDYAKLAALGGEGEQDERLLVSLKKRVPWLVVLLFLGLAVSAVVGLFEGVVNELPMIVAFQSLILGMAGNVGTQSLAVTVRLLGEEERLGLRHQLSLVLREGRVALLNGAVLGGLCFLIVSGYLCLRGACGAELALSVALCVGVAMCFAMTVSGLTGAAIPISLYRLGVDPAVASGPLITTVNDLVAVIGYYGLAWALLHGVG